MALAKKCDRCKKLYMPRTVKTDNGQKFNGIMLIERDDNNVSYGPRGSKDLCPECLNEFVRFMNTRVFVEEETDA